MMHKQVVVMDAVMAVIVLESSLHDSSNKKSNSEFHWEPDELFEQQQIQLLKPLQRE